MPLVIEQQHPVSPARVSSAMGDFASSFAWDFFATLTADDMDVAGRRHRRPVTDYALRAEVGRFVRRMSKMAPDVAYVLAYQGLESGNGHVHALLGNCPTLSPWRVRRAWKAGITDVEKYDANLPGAHYATRFAGADPDQIEISATMPPRLHLVRDGAISSLDDHEADGMLELVANSQKTPSRTASVPLQVSRIPSTEIVGDAWVSLMARIVLREAGIAA